MGYSSRRENVALLLSALARLLGAGGVSAPAYKRSDGRAGGHLTLLSPML